MADEWDQLQGFADQIAGGVKSGLLGEAVQAAPRAKLDIALVQQVVEQMRQSTKVIYPALADLGSEIKRHREAVVAAAASSDKSASALGWWTLVLAIATVVLAMATLVPLFTGK